MSKSHARGITMVSMAAALIAVLAFFPPIPLPYVPVPIVLQNIAIMFISIVLGPKYGTYAIGLFLILVAIGMPFLSGGNGGIKVFYGPTSFYLFAWLLNPIMYHLFQKLNHGYLILTYILGWLAFVLMPNIIGAIGIAMFSHISYWNALSTTLIFYIGDTFKAITAILIGLRLKPIIQMKVN